MVISCGFEKSIRKSIAKPIVPAGSLSRALTAARRPPPRVSHGGRSVIVTIDERGSARWAGRALDPSRGVAAHLAMLGAGVACAHAQILE